MLITIITKCTTYRGNTKKKNECDSWNDGKIPSVYMMSSVYFKLLTSNFQLFTVHYAYEDYSFGSQSLYQL